LYALHPVSTTKPSARVVLRYRFGPYEADLTRDELRKFGVKIRLEPKPWYLLVVLLERAGELVTRSELQRALWGEDVFVDFEHGLNVAVKKLRGALSDSIEVPAYIETVAGEGYRFVAEVEKVFAAAYAPVSASPEPIANTLVPQVPAFSSMQLAEAAVPQLEQRAEPRLLAGSIRHSWWQKRKAWPAVAVMVCVALLTIAVARLTWRRLLQPQHVHAGKIMLVVLPFENLSGDPSQEYFSDGMTEELSEQLGNQDPTHLGVIGRTSAMTYKYSHRSIREIGKELGVDYVLEGSVRRSGSDVRVTAQLVQVSDQVHVWAASHDENLRNLLQLETNLAREIARQVRVSIAVRQVKTPVQPHVPNLEAHEAYLLGRYNWYKRTSVGWKSGEDYFRLAIQKDPEYAAAYAALAECRIPKGEAQAAALKAIALDPTSGEAYTALAWVQLYWYLDPTAAGTAFERAIELAPNYAQAHYSYAHYLETAGRPYEAVNEVKKAISLDPLSPLFNSGLGNALAEVGQLEEAVKQFKVVLEMNPQFTVAHGGLGRVYLKQGKYSEAIEEFQTEGKIDGNFELGLMGYAYSRSGNKKQALKILSQLYRLQKKSPDAAPDLAMIELGLGNHEKAIAWLQKVYEDHEDDILLTLQGDPVFDPLRIDPRFQDIVRRMNFPP
jgi:TolB-like protein/DNA-binding winged helix-turn-helix (wHTH) protein/Flp pilus assembly protein TadD